MREERDAVDGFVEQWARERPELDSGPMQVVGRLHRLAALLDVELATVFREAGLGNGDFDVLASLRRSGPPYRLRSTDLAATTMVTSGAVTKRVDRLERLGLVTRSVHAEDARGREIALTEDGRALVDDLVGKHWANEDRLLASLDADERHQLAGLLRRLLVDVEGSA
jgi:DNA-binding MarR family transcriptional regulator